MSDHKDLQVLFVGLGNSRVAWYRCFLPGLYLGADWMGMVGTPPNVQVVTSYVQGDTKAAKFEDYDVIVLQQPRGKGWFKTINSLRAAGKIVLYEVDDFVHGIRKSTDHDFKEYFQPEHLREMELCMLACDGLIASTEYIARKYKRYCKRTWVCENGLDMGRYRLTIPPRGKINERDTVTLMWSGATGHTRGISEWISMVDRVMADHDHVCFASIGQGFAMMLQEKYPGRTIAAPFAALETYPAAMMIGDIALAPAGKSSWYRGKSGLRAMEAAALGLPVVADLHYENEVVDGVTGLLAENAAQAEEDVRSLIECPKDRLELGANARAHAIEHFDMQVRRASWRSTILDAWREVHGEV